MCGGAAWPAGVLGGNAGGSHRIAKCNAKGKKSWPVVSPGNHIFRGGLGTQLHNVFHGLGRRRNRIKSNGGRLPARVSGRFCQPDRTTIFWLTLAFGLRSLRIRTEERIRSGLTRATKNTDGMFVTCPAGQIIFVTCRRMTGRVRANLHLPSVDGDRDVEQI